MRKSDRSVAIELAENAERFLFFTRALPPEHALGCV